MTFENRLNKQYNELSKSQKLIGDFIKENLKLIPLLSISDIARKCDVSLATVTRFAQALNYSGFQELQNEIKNLCAKELTPFRELKSLRNDNSKSNEDLLSKIIMCNIKALEDLYNYTDIEKLDKIIKLMQNSKDIYIVASRSSYCTAYYLYILLKGIVKDVHLLTDINGSLTFELQHILPEDMLIAITYPKYSKKTYDITKYFLTISEKVIALTDSYTSPIASISKYTVIANNGEDSYSYVSTMTILNTLVVGYIKQLDESEKRFKIHDEIANLFDSYL